MKTQHSHFNSKRNNLKSQNKEDKRILPANRRSNDVLPKNLKNLSTNGIFRDEKHLRMGQKISRREQIESSRGQLSTQSAVQTGDIQRQMMQKAQEYWWKSGYIEGLKRNLGDSARESSLATDSLFQGSSASNEHLLKSMNNRGSGGGRTEVSHDLNNGHVTNGMSENNIITNTRYLRLKPQDTNRGQIRTSASQMDANIGQVGRSRYINSHSDTTRVQTGSLVSGEENKNKGRTGVPQDTNTRQGQTSGERNTGQTSITSITGGQQGTNIKRLGTTDRQSGILNRQLKTSVNTNRGQLRTSQDRNIGQLGTRGPQSSTNRAQSGTTVPQVGTNTGQWRSSGSSTTGQPGMIDGQMRKDARQTPMLDTTNQRQWSTFMSSITGQTRTTEGQSGGQPGNFAEVRSGTSSENGAVEKENAEISKSPPGM